MTNLNSLFQIVDDFAAGMQSINRPLFDFPKYNIVKTDNGYAVEMALAGFDKSELSVKASQGVVEVCGIPAPATDTKRDMIFKGISMRPFKVRMAIPYGAPVGGVKFDNGILSFEFGDKPSETKELVIK